MKLIRLTSNDNGNFRSSFGNDMILAPYSKMALLNLTMQTDLGQIIIGQGDSITTQTDTTRDISKRTVNVNSQTFRTNSLEDWVKYVQLLRFELNKTLVLSRGFTTDSNSTGSCYTTGNQGNGMVEIVFRYCNYVNALSAIGPPLPPVPVADPTGRISIMELEEDEFDINTIFTAAGAGPIDPNAGLEILTSIAKEMNAEATNNNKTNMFSSTEICPGAGFMTCRVADYYDNLSGGQDNGFAIGLSTVDLVASGVNPGDTIPSDKVFAEIRFNRTTDKYRYITFDNQNVEFTSDLFPLKTSLGTDINVNAHDILAFEVEKGIVSLVVYQDKVGDAARQVLAIQNMTPQTKLYPYFYIRGQNILGGAAGVGVMADMLNFTVNTTQIIREGGASGDGRSTENWGPESDDEEGEGFYGQRDFSGQFNGTAQVQRYGTAPVLGGSNNINLVLPSVMFETVALGSAGVRNRWNRIPIAFPKLQLDISSNLIKALGFTGGTGNEKFTQELDNPFWSAVFDADELPQFYNSDNFIIESNSLPLDSYDASQVEYGTDGTNFSNTLDKRGRRKNILMTIPINDNTSGLVEFETNSPIFIDLNNKNTINTKNLNFKVLRKDFTPIRQGDEMAIMTILIDSEREK